MKNGTTSQRVYSLLAMLPMLAYLSCLSIAQEIPRFRHIDSGQVTPPETVTTEVRLLTDQDFAPFSYKNAAGELVGISVEIATATCVAVQIKCQITALPFAELLPAMAQGQGDAIISGFRTSEKMMKDISLTRPYYISSAQFIARLGSSFPNPDIKTLAGRRVGFVKGTSHQAFLEKYFFRSALTGFATQAEMLESLRTGGLDVAFTDALQANFWLAGKSSRACCEVLGEGFFDRTNFSRGLSFLVKRNQPILRENFDYGLDQVQLRGEAAKIFNRYLPKTSF